ncbi:MAG TPA: phosphomannomutase/phosphoglucomutase [Chloroflexia bacterium]|nr:phosphomannomutase/phosphoglucomutase [Chloroflexia bacterium]
MTESRDSAGGHVAVNPQIFREYDIRGIVDQDLTGPTLEAIGMAYGTWLNGQDGDTSGARKRVAVGRDVRQSSQRFAESLIVGLRRAGCDVINVGEVPTPVLYFAVGHFDTDGGVEVTASHNPPEFNGLKMRKRPHGLNAPLATADVAAVGKLAVSGQFDTSQGEGGYQEVDVLEVYKQYIFDTVKPQRRLKAVIDAGNGACGPTAVDLYTRMGVDVVPLFIEPDGTFPNHMPNPLKEENMRDLQAKVRETGADIGIGLDGDGDRLGVVDNEGNILWPDQYMILLAREVLARAPGPIIFDVKCSRALIEDIEAHGGTPTMYRTGYPNIFAKRLETGAAFAGEYSGHMFFDDARLDFDDGMYAGARLLRALGSDERPISERFKEVPRYYNTPEGRLDVAEADKFGVIKALVEQFQQDYKVVTLDGARVEFPDGWFLVRASNTEPSLTTRFEAKTPERLEEIRGILREALKAFPQVRGTV